MQKKGLDYEKKGFSLAEMMIVMLVLSIVLAAMMPIMTKKAKQTQTQAPSSPHGKKLFESNGIFLVPDGVKTIWVTLVGGGGGGGYFYENSSLKFSGQGGHAGEVIFNKEINTTSRQQFYITVGTGGGGSESEGRTINSLTGKDGTASCLSSSANCSGTIYKKAAGGNGGKYFSSDNEKASSDAITYFGVGESCMFGAGGRSYGEDGQKYGGGGSSAGGYIGGLPVSGSTGYGYGARMSDGTPIVGGIAMSGGQGGQGMVLIEY